MTYSLLLRDPETEEIGCGVASRFLAVGAAVLHAEAENGAIATQALANVSFGKNGLEMLSIADPADAVLSRLLADDDQPQRRQVGVLDAAGTVASHTGTGCQPWAGHAVGTGYACPGNMLAGPDVLTAMERVVRAHVAGSPVAETVLLALRAAESAGGDRRGRQSAALLVVRSGGGYGGTSDRVVDLRVDDHPAPLDELGRLLILHGEIFSKPDESELMPLEGATLREVVALLAPLSSDPLEGTDADGAWRALERWAGGKNLEERLIRPYHVDPVLLGALRRATRSSEEPSTPCSPAAPPSASQTWSKG